MNNWDWEERRLLVQVRNRSQSEAYVCAFQSQETVIEYYQSRWTAKSRNAETSPYPILEMHVIDLSEATYELLKEGRDPKFILED